MEQQIIALRYLDRKRRAEKLALIGKGTDGGIDGLQTVDGIIDICDRQRPKAFDQIFGRSCKIPDDQIICHFCIPPLHLQCF